MSKILIMGTDSNISGASLSMIYLIKYLKKQNIDVVAIIPGHGELEEIFKKENIDYYIEKSYSWIVDNKSSNIWEYIKKYIKIIIKSILNFKAIYNVRKIIKKENIDIVHINTLYSYIGAIAAKKENKKLIWHIREFLEEDQNKKFAFRKYAYNLIKKSDIIICISNTIYEKYSKIFKNNQMKVIYNGIDLDNFKPNRKEILNKPIHKFVLVGTIQEGKGQKELILAISRLIKDGYNNFILYLMGHKEKKYFKEIQEIIEKNNLNDYIKYIGLSKEVAKHMNEADISFVCSRYEAFGRVTIESMLSGCLVIGANTAGTKELVIDKKTGLLYEQGNIESLVVSIKEALNNKEVSNKIAHNSINYAKDNFNAKKNAEEIKKVYDELMEN